MLLQERSPTCFQIQLKSARFTSRRFSFKRQCWRVSFQVGGDPWVASCWWSGALAPFRCKHLRFAVDNEIAAPTYTFLLFTGSHSIEHSAFVRSCYRKLHHTFAVRIADLQKKKKNLKTGPGAQTLQRCVGSTVL